MHGLDEVAAAWQEFADKRSATHEAVRDAMKLNRSVRQGSGWDHSSLSTTGLRAAADECAAMPRQTPEGKSLVEHAAKVCELREALAKATPMDGRSWEAVAAVLGSIVSAEVVGMSEVRAAWQEFKEARLAIEKKLRSAMREGRSKRRPGAGGGNAWDHSAIDVDGLKAALQQLNVFPAVEGAAAAAASGANAGRRSSATGGGGGGGGGGPGAMERRPSSFVEAQATLSRKSSVGERPAMLNRQSMLRLTQESANLSEVVDFLVALRQALLATDWAEVSTMMQQATDFPLQDAMGNEEVQQAALELEDTAQAAEEAVATAMEGGRSKRGATAESYTWDHSGLEVSPLEEAIGQLQKFPVPRPTAAATLAKGRVVLAVRKALLEQDWGVLQNYLDKGIEEKEHLQLDEVVAARRELQDASKAVTESIVAALKTGRSTKVYGKKTATDKLGSKFVTEIKWDRSGLSTERLTAAVAAAKKFPSDSMPPEIAKLYEQAAAASTARELLAADDFPKLKAFLEGLPVELAREMDELKMCWQEYLTWELAKVTKSKKQDELKRVLKDASEYGMKNDEKPVWAALEVFVDPPTIIYQPPAQMWPDAAGKVTLRCNIRSADTIAWYKNGIPLKEGADGGRVTGVATNQVVFSKLLGRDKGAKIYARGKNKWGQVETSHCELMLPGTGGPASGQAMAAKAGGGGMGGGDAAADGRDSASSEKRADMLTEVTSAAKSFLTGGKKGRGLSVSRKTSNDTSSSPEGGRARPESMAGGGRARPESISEEDRARGTSIAMNAEL